MNKIHLCLMLLLLIPVVSGSVDYFSDRMNFPPGESRIHIQNLSSNESIVITATVPAGFNVTSTDCNQSGSVLTCGLSAGGTKTYTLTSPSTCTEGTKYVSSLTSNSSFSGEFVFVCISDVKITDCKVEYGHGDANYLPKDQLFISNETVTIFNLYRVFNIGHYLNPDEDALNATATCSYEVLPVRTFGRVEIDHGMSEINGTFFWNEIEGGYWFRIGVVSQDVVGKNVGDDYNVSCGNLVYKFAHTQVVANSTTCDLRIRSTEPFNCSYANHTGGKATITLHNIEEYNTYDISFDKTLDSAEHTETYAVLESGEDVSYVVDQSTEYNLSVFFIPSWYINSWHPQHYKQELSCGLAVNSPPILDPIPNQTACVNTTFVYDANATDANGDILTYTDNTTLFEINSSTGVFSFTPNSSQIGNYTVEICVSDPFNASDCEAFVIEVLVCPTLGNCSLVVEVNPDNQSIDLNWTDANATSYNIYISTNPTTFGVANVTGITDLNWTDSGAGGDRQRFYRVEAVKGAETSMCAGVACKYTYDVLSSSDNLKGKNLITLACNRSYTAEEFLLKAPTSSYLTQLNRWNNPEVEYWQSHPKGSSLNNFTMELGRGYLMFVTSNNTFTIAGGAITSPVSLDLVSSASGLKGKNLVGLPYTSTGQTAESFIQGATYGSYITQLNRWNNPEVEFWQSHPKGSSVNNFTMDIEGRGYLTFVTQNETYTPS